MQGIFICVRVNFRPDIEIQWLGNFQYASHDKADWGHEHKEFTGRQTPVCRSGCASLGWSRWGLAHEPVSMYCPSNSGITIWYLLLPLGTLECEDAKKKTHMIYSRSPERAPLDLHLSSYKQTKPQNKTHKQTKPSSVGCKVNPQFRRSFIFFPPKIFCVWVPACMYVCSPHACLVPSEAKEGHPSPRNGGTDGCKSQRLRARK